jgi:hypothetical protein
MTVSQKVVRKVQRMVERMESQKAIEMVVK